MNCFNNGVDTSMTSPRDMVVQGDYIYYVDKSENKMVVVDVSDPATDLYFVSELSNAGGELLAPEGIYVDGDYAYVTSETSDMVTIIDISTPASPSVVGSVSDSTALDEADNVFVVGGKAYIGNQASGFAILDIIYGSGTKTPNRPFRPHRALETR